MANAKKKKTSKKKTSSKKSPDKKGHDVKVVPFKRDLVCELDEEQMRDRADKLGHVVQQRDAFEESMKAEAKTQRETLKGLDRELRKLSSVIRERAEWREVKCERRVNYTTGVVTDVRLDSGEVIEERAMTDDERQKGLEFGDVDSEFGDDPDGDDKSDGGEANGDGDGEEEAE